MKRTAAAAPSATRTSLAASLASPAPSTPSQVQDMIIEEQPSGRGHIEPAEPTDYDEDGQWELLKHSSVPGYAEVVESRRQAAKAAYLELERREALAAIEALIESAEERAYTAANAEALANSAPGAAVSSGADVATDAGRAVGGGTPATRHPSTARPGTVDPPMA